MAEDANLRSVFASAELPQLKLLHLLQSKGSHTAKELEELACLSEASSILSGFRSSPGFPESSGGHIICLVSTRALGLGTPRHDASMSKLKTPTKSEEVDAYQQLGSSCCTVFATGHVAIAD